MSSLIVALAISHWLLLVARLLTALGQALFWAVMGPVAVGLFAPEVRGRVVGALSVAGSLALVLGVPAGGLLTVGACAALLGGGFPPGRDDGRNDGGGDPTSPGGVRMVA